jgi:hypothetical protein
MSIITEEFEAQAWQRRLDFEHAVAMNDYNLHASLLEHQKRAFIANNPDLPVDFAEMLFLNVLPPPQKAIVKYLF